MIASELEKMVAFRETPGQRLPCLLLLDTSGSMRDRIGELNDGIQVLHASLSDPDSDPVARNAVELAIMTFDSDIKLIQDFALAKDITVPTLTAQNQTFMGQALIEALDCIEQRKQLYKKVGSPHYRPLIFMLTDGMPEGEPPGVLDEAKRRVRRAQDNQQVKIWPVCVGAEINPVTLGDITGTDALRLDETKWNSMFVWLSASLATVSRSNEMKPGEQVQLAPPNWTQW